ncbi:lasso peptide biosynthesis PqqD family chaperone [Ectobacillus sp. JY-23]|uniref:lasso peptide biosynthesis PqqD family chaperone n=1 Tax=Ectobacillus sp. JY-23 TaxID=2933872 RepID=UPI001FF5766B|nr:lasso peptide biosynthesis PqqD family chaperone [Ectobacillus sp. JY-23]UOY92715.1 lasso peptide biosynthesis PqqD family chaperone [Ectobacillus sp. JY-23]
MNQTLNIQQTVVQVQGNLVSDMGGEKVMLSIENGKYYNLGEMGGVIWDLLVEPICIAELVEKLVREYDVERNICEAHVISFLSMLEQENLVKLVG